MTVVKSRSLVATATGCFFRIEAALSLGTSGVKKVNLLRENGEPILDENAGKADIEGDQ